ncbi:MAG: hypothetical protein IJS01_10390 [Lentisphaeria bacterium]|nr:hypothetical protein [Lentisphaeria bacterium]
MKEIIQTALAILGSVGIGGAIVAALSSWLGKVWAERLMAKESAKYREELERLTKRLERKNYVSRVRFDAEFAIYRDLSAAFLEVVKTQNHLFTFYRLDSVPEDKPKQKNFYITRMNKCTEAFNKASIQLHCNAPFIEESIFERFRNILRDVDMQLFHYPAFYIDDFAFESRRESKALFEECSRRTQTINDDMDKLISDLRAYLKNLDVA